MATFNYFNVPSIVEVYQLLAVSGYQITTAGNGMYLIAQSSSGNTGCWYAVGVNGDTFKFYLGPSANDPANAPLPSRVVDPVACTQALDGIWINSSNMITPLWNYSSTRPYTDLRYGLLRVNLSTIAYGDPVSTNMCIFFLDIPKYATILYENCMAGPGGSGYIHSVTIGGTDLIDVLIGGMSLSQAALDAIVAGLAENLQIVNNINVEPSAVAVDLTGVEAKLDLLVKDATFAAKNMGGDPPDLSLIETALGDIGTAVGDVATRPDLTAQLNETNRQLSLIDSRMHHDVPQGGVIDLIDVLSGGAASGYKILAPDGTAIDLGDWLDQIVAAIAAGSKLNAAKLEPFRGLLEAIKGQWTQ